ncbi:DNA-directed RNA polymerase III subunit RPC8 [Planococcus citri]|uniref:DNA-directed RNA polymerase III subunit RPC8 n=1 Tax=Planococcus citri TaxID=170843 RepID=UPI0031F9BC2D
MFILVEFDDVVKIKPSLFSESLESSISDALNKKLSNKVVPNVGLCIALFDFLEINESFIFPGEGAHHSKIKYRFVVFRPFMSEIIIGKIKSCTQQGIQVTLGFFDDIQIPASCLQHPSKFDEEEQAWIWEYENLGQKHNLYMDVGEKIKFRIMNELFMETSPEVKTNEVKSVPENKTPYLLIGSINEPGLGVLSWWDGM